MYTEDAFLVLGEDRLVDYLEFVEIFARLEILVYEIYEYLASFDG